MSSPSALPTGTRTDADNLDQLEKLLDGRRVVVLGGAGCSTESGIPDYRGPDGRLRARRPMLHDEFVRSPDARRRYWARSAVGWRRVATAQPNAAHKALARLEAGGVVRGIITQNVDGLHHAAGSTRVVELHGSLARVRCLTCGTTVLRGTFQHRLIEANPLWVRAGRSDRGDLRPAPDGDADLADGDVEHFRVPSCDACGGVLKPDVVFFGDSVPPERVRDAWILFDEADVLLVVGSSLEVFSGRRFAYRAARDGVPIGVVNLGPTRIDELAAAKVEGRAGRVLHTLADALLGTERG